MNFYLSKYGFIPPQVAEPVAPGTGIIVVIPCFNEPDLLSGLVSLAACGQPGCRVEVITVINSPDNADDTVRTRNAETLRTTTEWAVKNSTSWLTFHFIVAENLPPKHAGVGLARKIGMDEAVARFEQLGTDGIIACFDADATCDPDYLTALERHFEQHSRTPGCSVYFEHPVTGKGFDTVIYEAIIQYELHLRYYRQALVFCGLPYGFHSVGSSMAVRSSAYQKQGGMNKRKAGEDFYFLHKIIALGDFTELNTTRVIPSPRVSDRVPFGTGRAVGEWVEEGKSEYRTYHFGSFLLIRDFVSGLPGYYRSDRLPQPLSSSEAFSAFLQREGFEQALQEMKANAASETTFVKRFYTWFDAFRVLKLVHFLRDNGLPNVPVTQAVADWFGTCRAGNSQPVPADARSQLLDLRLFERFPKTKTPEKGFLSGAGALNF